MAATALCAYAVLPAHAAMAGDPALRLVTEGPVAALVGTVPRAEYEAGPEGRGEDPAWIAEQAARHHAVVTAAAAQLGGAALPLALGALFSAEDPLRRWLADRAATLAAALAAIAGCEEWVVALREDDAAHEAWLAARDPDLLALDAQARSAGEGRGFLISRQRQRLATARLAERRRALGAAVADALARHARHLAPEGRAPRWNGLVPRDSVAALRSEIDAMAREMAQSGVTPTLSGPWPAYAFAREAVRDA